MANPRITNLKIKNFGCIGANGISVDIDKIVVLIGPNNSGKSTILRAFEVVTECLKLDQDDFFNRQILPHSQPEIELTSIANEENKPGNEWCFVNADGTYAVREKWTWGGAGVEPKRVGFNVPQNRWAQAGDAEQMPWGMNNLAKARRPKPHRVNTFDDADSQSRAVISLLRTLLEASLRSLKTNPDDPLSRYQQIVDSLKLLRSDSKRQQFAEITQLQANANQVLNRIFPGETFTIISPEVESEVSIDLLGDEFDSELGGAGAVSLPLARQGSGTRRTVLWTILKLLADKGFKAKTAAGKTAKAFHEPVGPNSAHILLLDEPEVSLHPRAIDSVRDVLYSLPESENWQVMVTTHSPNFIDLTRDHTTIVRVERTAQHDVLATTLFRPEQAQLSADDKENLKLTNLFDSHISEAFFGGRVLVVEGDTEYSAFSYIKRRERDSGNMTYSDLNIIRARGKVTVASMMKVLNHFGTRYFVLHDTDRPRVSSRRKDKGLSKAGQLVYQIVEIANPAWTNNGKILAQMTERSRVVASLVNFEQAYFDEIAEAEKPENSVSKLRSDAVFYTLIKDLLDSVLELPGSTLPPGALAWRDLAELEAAVVARDAAVTIRPAVAV
jgi:putative ATP-dependent endonuclease of OLD family